MPNVFSIHQDFLFVFGLVQDALRFNRHLAIMLIAPRNDNIKHKPQLTRLQMRKDAHAQFT